MASRAILRRKRFLDQYLNASSTFIPSSNSLLRRGTATQDLTSPPSAPPSDNPHGAASPSFPSVEPLYFSRLGFRPYARSFSISRDFASEFNAPMGMRWMSASQSLRRVSTATAKQPDDDNERNEEMVAKKRKEASPEECDQAVEGLTTVKAKAKAKRQQESQKDSQSILQRVWATFLGIGPALRAVASMSREDWAKKLVHWKTEFVSTLQHYWLGFKLLWVDVRISSRLLLKLAGGKSLTRRERQQLTRTTADIFRLVPFAVFIIVPFMEFLLPVALKLFPNMLPSTFQDKMKEQEALKRRLKARIEYARFLQDTVKEMAKEVQNSRSGEIKKTAEDLDEFLNLIRRGSRVSNEEILGFAKLFNDELTLDNISRPRLVNMCKYMGISPFGTDAYLRYMLRKRLQRIKEDDRLIQAEGVDSLSEAELREDCRERGMLGLLSVEEMRQQLRDWLDLSLNHSVPSSLLILSRAFTVSGKLKPEEAVQATLSSLPDEVVDTVGITSLPSEDSVSERRRKLEFLEMQEELIKEEEEREEVEQARKDINTREDDKALKEMNISSAKEAHQLARARALENKEQLCELSRALAVLASASSVSTEREDFLRLVNKEIELYNSVVEKEGTDSEKAAFKAYKAAREEDEQDKESGEGDRVSSALIERVDAMLHNLEKEIDDVDAKIGDRWRLLDRDYDGKVTPEEVASAAMYLKDTLGKEGVQELISSLSKDKEGKILVEDIVKLGGWREDGDGHAAEEGRM
ncbi:hypothetical protein HN51_037926 [Arachis hypogaea]|uniref:uncharacterized protein n=1 Tax=Arachis hypogaea TaxID=3818 RepID=UPI000DEC3BE5|nr:mitochondrial proton/calcium exchanger protein [Arachis hypogaea]XP_025690993.1 mitochondrial proton/calcium exchanger protein [Arachis hypogaea]QHO03551.1 LETM1 and EF-hand domain-containing protein 1 [Arachis hypogaea]QHO03552.1 LETM1 and EF-hand domain-containing protein 1 [Arachis hypogaea]